jgi:hypothetical protein
MDGGDVPVVGFDNGGVVGCGVGGVVRHWLRVPETEDHRTEAKALPELLLSQFACCACFGSVTFGIAFRAVALGGSTRFLAGLFGFAVGSRG